MVGYTRLSGQVCRQTSHLSDKSIPFPADVVDYLDYQVLQWHKQIPPNLKFDSSELQGNPHAEGPNPVSLFLRVVLQARMNQLRNLIYRPVLYHYSRISENRGHAQTAVDIARESVQFLSTLNRTTNFVNHQPVFFKHFLISAFAAVLLAVANASADFSHQVRDEFYMALDVFRSLSFKSTTMMRVWKTVKNLETIGSKLGLSRAHETQDNDGRPPMSTYGRPIEQPGTSLPWYPQEPDGEYFDMNGASASQLRNELLGGMPNLFDFALTENFDRISCLQ